MSEFEEIQKLIRLKRHERPPEGFVDGFLRSFHNRQRSEMLQQSARGLLWERVTTYFSGMLNPKWTWATATAAVVVLVGFTLRPHQPAAAVAESRAEASDLGTLTAQDPNAFKADVASYLKAIESEARGSGGSQFTGAPMIIQPTQGGMLPAGLRFDAMPVLPQR